MSERGQHPEDGLDEEIARLESAGFAFPVTDETLMRAFEKLEPQQPSAKFRQRTTALLAKLRQGKAPQLGATLVRWREAAALSFPTLRQRLPVDPSILHDLERNLLYPETLSATFWRSYAETLQRTADEIADLLETYDRGTIAVAGLAAARSGKTLRPEERAAFLTEVESEQLAKLDEKRAKLVAALRR